MAVWKLRAVFTHLHAVEFCARRFVRSATRFADAGLIASLLIAGGLPAFAAGETRNVLVLYSNGRLLPANIQGDRGLRETISTTADRPVIVFDEFLDAPRFSGQTYVQTFVTYLREKYSSHPVDVVVVAGGDALRFLLDNRAELFPRVPVIHMGVSQALLQSISPLPAGVVGVPVQYNFSDTTDQALRWHPQVRHLVIVTGAAAQDRKWEAQLRADVSRFKDRATAEFLTGLTTNAVQNRLRELGGDAVVFTPGYFQDGAGRYVTPREAGTELLDAIKAVIEHERLSRM